ncbi:MAG: response regulator transcription factor [Microcystis aeruginosa W13-18]|nr:response regulator transcription factor [Microcystis aeruginosa W13-18]NCR34959.1 response regulator transcription factor [Microcystis aeruginosa S11-05]NCR48438.1 response regulator transcription factor [Microcystis aeruginosa S11-01]
MNEKVDFLKAWDNLTRQEKVIFICFLDGVTDQEIADKLFLSRRTITTHVHHILKKFCVKSRAELLVFYYRDSGFLVVKDRDQITLRRRTLSTKEG